MYIYTIIYIYLFKSFYYNSFLYRIKLYSIYGESDLVLKTSPGSS